MSNKQRGMLIVCYPTFQMVMEFPFESKEQNIIRLSPQWTPRISAHTVILVYSFVSRVDTISTGVIANVMKVSSSHILIYCIQVQHAIDKSGLSEWDWWECISFQTFPLANDKKQEKYKEHNSRICWAFFYFKSFYQVMPFSLNSNVPVSFLAIRTDYKNFFKSKVRRI